MDFNLIIDKLFSEYLLSLNFNKTDSAKNEVIFESDQIVIRFIYDAYAYHYYYFINLKQENINYENFMVEDYLKIKLEPKFGLNKREKKIEYIAKSQLNYFETFKDKLLMGDREFYAGLKKYFETRNKQYNKKFGK